VRPGNPIAAVVTGRSGDHDVGSGLERQPLAERRYEPGGRCHFVRCSLAASAGNIR
jgi:hypothetical protein